MTFQTNIRNQVFFHAENIVWHARHHKSSRKINKEKMFCLFVALRPKSTAMIIAGRSVHLTTPFPGQA